MQVGKSYKVQRVNYAWNSVRDKSMSTVADWGRCVWIHPEGRFAVMEFADGVRECVRLIGGQYEKKTE